MIFMRENDILKRIEMLEKRMDKEEELMNSLSLATAKEIIRLSKLIKQ